MRKIKLLEKKIKAVLEEKGLHFTCREISKLANKEDVYEWAIGKLKDEDVTITNVKFLKKYYKKLASLRYYKQPLLQKFKAEHFLEVERLFDNFQPDMINKTLNRYEKERWSKHLELPLLEQEKIKNAKVVIFGLGGIGTNVLLNLVYSGVYNYRIVDNDTVELSNLNRQTLYIPDDVEKLKSEVTKKRLLEINPNLNIKSYNLKVDYPSGINLLKDKEIIIPNEFLKIDKLIKWGDIIVNALDYYGAPYLVNDLCIKNEKPFYWGSVMYSYGVLYSYLPKKTACLRCIFGPYDFFNKHQTLRYRTQKSAFVGAVLGSTAIISGNFIAGMIINDVCKLKTEYHGKYIVLDTYKFEIDKIPLYIYHKCECNNWDNI